VLLERVVRKLGEASHTLGMKDIIRKAPDKNNVTTADAISALVPCVSKCWGHSGVHHGFVDRCLLKVSSVCAEVPSIAMLNATTKPVMMVCAKCRGAGLTFILSLRCVYVYPDKKV
jgi:hypothetical protein